MEPYRERIEDFMQRTRANVAPLDVIVGTIATDTPFATYKLRISGPMTKVVVTDSGGEGYEEVLCGMLRALAVLGFRGEVRVRYLSDLDRLAATLEITEEYAEQVKAEEVGHALVEAQQERAEPHPGSAGAQKGTQRQQAQRPPEEWSTMRVPYGSGRKT